MLRHKQKDVQNESCTRSVFGAGKMPYSVIDRTFCFLCNSCLKKMKKRRRKKEKKGNRPRHFCLLSGHCWFGGRSHLVIILWPYHADCWCILLIVCACWCVCQVKKFKAYRVNAFNFDAISKLAVIPEFNSSHTVFPMPDDTNHYKLHR